jgi:acylphosphatase
MTAANEKAAAQVLVTGVVQRVGYRMWTTRTARALGLTGFVRNLDDGRVEIHAEGDARAVDALVTQCWQGPPGARVDEVTRAAKPVRGATQFVQVGDAAQPEP